MKDKYRFITGSLYKYHSGAYIHVWKNPQDNTEEKAIKSYNEHLVLEEEMKEREAWGYY